MSAKLATYDQTPLRWGTPPYTAVRCAARIRMLLANALALIGVGTMLALNPLGLQLALATDLTQPRTVARVPRLKVRSSTSPIMRACLSAASRSKLT